MDEVDTHAQLLGIVGVVLLAGHAAHVLGRRAHVPRVTLLLLLGVAVGPGGFDLAPTALHGVFPMVTQLSLSFIGFLLGERFLSTGHGISLGGLAKLAATETLVTAVFVLLAVGLSGQPWPLAILLAGVAPASAPAATVDVIREAGAKGPVTDAALAVVAIDDAYGIVLFSLLLAFAQGLTGVGGDAALGSAVWEVVGAVLLGTALGLPMAWLTGKLRPGEPTLVEALGFILTAGGLASLMHVSHLLACMTMGAVVARRARHHTRPFHAIDGIADPFLVLFFLLAGFEFAPASLTGMGTVAAVYVVGRALGKIAGGWLGATVAGSGPVVARYVGLCVMPQAGVALGLGLVAADRFPQWGEQLLALLVGTTLAFELLGPLATRFGLRSAGELPP